MEPAQPVFTSVFDAPKSATDLNGHVSNVAFVQWMQDVAVRHSEASGGTRAMQEAGGTWVIRSHRVDYLKPVFAGDRLTVLTWVADCRRAGSLRRYSFVRGADSKVVAVGETDWVFVDAVTGRPRTIPEGLRACFPLRPDLDPRNPPCPADAPGEDR